MQTQRGCNALDGCPPTSYRMDERVLDTIQAPTDVPIFLGFDPMGFDPMGFGNGLLPAIPSLWVNDLMSGPIAPYGLTEMMGAMSPIAPAQTVLGGVATPYGLTGE